MNYTELDWRWAILLGVAIRGGLLKAVADRCRKPEEVAGELDRAGFEVRTMGSYGGHPLGDNHAAFVARRL